MYKEKECAIKVFCNEAVQDLKDIQRESQLASIIQHHPNVVLVHGLWYGNAENVLTALVMELCHTNLQAYIQAKVATGQDESFDMATKSEILRDIASGMIYLHSEEIVHGNLTASNVLLNINGSEMVAKVTDFGQLRLADPQFGHHNTAMRGRSDIMPPEVKDSQSPVELTKAVDVFSFGCLIGHVAYCHCPEQPSYTHGW